MIIVKFAPQLKPVLKHETHDQSSHGSWASGELSDDQIRNIVYNSKTVNEMYQEIAQLQGKSMKPKVAELSEDEVNLYRGVANSERDTAQLLEGKIPFTELQTWGQGIYATPDKSEASFYGQVIGIKLDKSAKLVQGELAWDKSFKVKFTDTGIESDWFDFDRTLEQIKRKEKDNFSVSDLRNLYWAGKGYDGFQPFDRETVLFNADKLTINSKDIKSGITKHATHDQKTHGSWARGIASELSQWSPKDKVPDGPRNATGTTEKFWNNWEYGVDGNPFVDLYRQYAGEILGLPVPKSDKDVGGTANYFTSRGFGGSSTETVRKQTEAVLDAIANGRPQPTLYRGIAASNEESRALLEQFTSLEEGDTIDMPLVSTTRSLGVAQWYAVGWSSAPNDSRVILKIQEGAKGVKVNPEKSNFPSDFETITSGKFEVVGKSEITGPYWERSETSARIVSRRGHDGNMKITGYKINDPNDLSWGSVDKRHPKAKKRYDDIVSGARTGDFSKLETPTLKYTNHRQPSGVEEGQDVTVDSWVRKEQKRFTVIEVKMVEPHVVKKGADLGTAFHNLFNDVPFIRDEDVLKHGTHDQKTHGNWASRLSDEVAGKIIQFTQEWGGLSIKMTDGSMPTSGYMVAKPPEFGAVVDAADFLDPVKGTKILGDYMVTHRKDLGSGKNYLGTWLNEGKVYLDVSENIQDVSAATKIGRERNQKAIWDVVNLQEIDTGGTGLAEKESQHGGVEKHSRDDRRRDIRVREADSRETNTVVIKFAPSLKPALKHYTGLHDQSSHGNWAAYGGMADLIRQREGDFDGALVESAFADLYLIDSEEANEYLIRNAMANDEFLQETFDSLYESRFDPDLAEQDGYNERGNVDAIESEVFAEMASDYRSEIADVYVKTYLSDTMQNTFNLEHDSSGIYSSVDEISLNDGGGMRIYGAVYSPEGGQIGEFARTFYPTESGGVRAEHDIFKINNPEYQGMGFGRFFTENVEAAYISAGVEKINLYSAWDGAYTWSRAGYDFDPSQYKLSDSIGSMNNANWRFSEFSKSDMAKYEDLVERSTSLDLKDPRFPFPHEYASLPDAKKVLYDEKVYFEKVLSAEGTRLREQPIDADGDGMIYDGTARERPAPASTKKP